MPPFTHAQSLDGDVVRLFAEDSYRVPALGARCAGLGDTSQLFRIDEDASAVGSVSVKSEAVDAGAVQSKSGLGFTGNSDSAVSAAQAEIAAGTVPAC